MFSPLKRFCIHSALGLTLILLIGSLLADMTGHIRQASTAFLIGIGTALGWAITLFLTHQTITKPLSRLAAASESSIAKDSLVLSDAMAALAQGDLTAHVDLNIQPLELTGSREVRELATVFNKVTTHLQHSAKEFNTLTDEPCQRLFYVGTDAYLEGRICGEAMGKALNGQGQVVAIIGSFSLTSQKLRHEGFKSALREKYPRVQIMETAENHNSAEKCYALTLEFLKRYPRLVGIYVAEGGSPFGAARALVETDTGARVKLVAHDLVDETMQYMEKGIVTATIGQDPFAQGHDPVIHLFNHLATGWNPSALRLLTSMDVVTPENYRQFWEPGRGIIESVAMAKRRAQPLRPSPRTLRIAVLGRDESRFWEPVHAGVLAAANKLKGQNATVEWMLPEGPKAQPDLATRVATIDELVKAGYDAIATDVFDKELIPYINRAVAAGVAVATFNGEPSSLRGLLEMLAQRAHHLMSLSRNLATTAKSSGEATRQITTTIQQVALGITQQSADVTKTSNSVEQMSRAIDGVARGSQAQASAVKHIANLTDQLSKEIETVYEKANIEAQGAAGSVVASQNSAQMVQNTIHGMQAIQSRVGLTAQKVKEMGTRSDKIGTIIETIEEIASQTNLLALNAAIEAARAGEHGKSFAVVADEVRKLAEKSASATKEISSLITQIQHTVTEAIQAMNESAVEVERGVTLAGQAGASIDEFVSAAQEGQQFGEAIAAQTKTMNGLANELVQAMDSISGVVEENTTATQEMASYSTKVNQAMENIASVSEENSAAVEEVSASSEEMSAQVEEVTSSTQSLAEMSQALQHIVAQFKLSAEQRLPQKRDVGNNFINTPEKTTEEIVNFIKVMP